MGHIQLATLPATKRWGEVVDLLGSRAADKEVIRASAIAGERALSGAAQDPALVSAVHLLAMVPQAARSGRFAAQLAALDIEVPDRPTLGDLTLGMSLALERAGARAGTRTDFSEISRRTLLGTFIAMADDALPGLFEAGPDDVRTAIARMGTPTEFSRAIRAFFGHLLADTLAYWLDRTLSTEVGRGRRFEGMSDRDAFDRALGQYCVEATSIIHEFAEDWYIQRLHQGGAVTPERAAAFTAVMFHRISAELRRKRGGDA